MSPITISINNMRANELAALHSITRGMERQAVMTTLRHLVGSELANALTDEADRLIDESLVEFDKNYSAKLDTEAERIHQKAIQVSRNFPPASFDCGD